MKTMPVFSLLLILGFTACHPAQLVISDELSTATALPVKGRNGFTIGQKLSFGDYRTGKVRRGWTTSYEIPFLVRFKNAKEKLSFDLYDPAGQRAEVSCISRFDALELPVLDDYFRIPLHYDNVFAGNIYLGDSHWDFVVSNPNGAYLYGEATGFAQNGDRRIDLVPIRKLQGQPGWMDKFTVYGYEFRENGRLVGAVSMLNRGEVRLLNDADAEMKLLASALATGLLLRHDPADGQG